jgi:nucleotide-binding universal stress UspA family protein
MTKKILVSTDLSKSSKAGVRFAIQLARQNGSTLIFYHVLEILKPTEWSARRFSDFAENEIKVAGDNLSSFITTIYKQAGVKPGKHEFVVQMGSPVDRTIIQYSVERKVDFICMGTRGAGAIRRLVGTYTSSVLKNSQIPVFAVPQNYRMEKITHILYSSDLTGLESELKKVKDFAHSVNARLSVLHYEYLYQLREIKAKFEKIARRNSESGVNFYFQDLELDNTLNAHLMKAMRKFKPSLVILFTRQNRDWFEQLYSSSLSARAPYTTKKPLLIFSKKA